jgi:hypothetical protein
MKVSNFLDFMKTQTIDESMMDDQWQKPEHAGNGGADEYSWAERDGIVGTPGDYLESNDSEYKEKTPVKTKIITSLTLYDLKEMLTDLSSRLKNLETSK